MAQVELIMPKMGESVAEATIIRWLKNVGDTIQSEEAVLEIATDKVDSEVPSSAAGVLLKKLFEEGQVVKVGTAIALIETSVGTAAPSVSPGSPSASLNGTSSVNVAASPAPAAAHAETRRPAPVSASAGGEKRFYSPLVRNIAREEGIPVAELDQLPGTGSNGRVTKSDILAYLLQRQAHPAESMEAEITSLRQAVPSATPSAEKITASKSYDKPAVVSSAGDEIIEMDRMRKLIADHMVMSKHVSPHVTSFVEADVTNIVQWRDRIKNDFEKREGEKITFTPVFTELILQAIRKYPMINSSVDGNKIILRKNINIGIATALPSGNLIVPVIKNADQLNLLGLTRGINDLTARARKNKLQPDEIQGGTFTISNVGTFGNVMGTPIINQPQVAIIALGAIRKKPVVIETPEGDTIGIRQMMFLSLSYDHRIVDGALGGGFLRTVADLMEDFNPEKSY